MDLKIIEKFTKNCRERKGPIRYIILHCSAFPPDKMLQSFDECGVSTHFIIGQDGSIIQNCEIDKVAYHAGVSSWKDTEGTSLNEVSIGIELETTTLGQEEGDYKKIQLTALYMLLKRLVFIYKIRPENILGHSDIAPTRKPDPGRAFPWHRFYLRGFGVWHNAKMRVQETDEETLLKMIGYDTSVLAAARCAFCRRFYPESVPIVSNIQELLDNPYPKDFEPLDYDYYIYLLRITARHFEIAREKKYWFLKD